MAGVSENLKEVVRLRYKGVFDLGKLVSTIKGWLGGRKYTVYEKKYKHKLKAKGTEIEIRITGDRFINEYVKNIIHVRFHCWDTKEVEVIKDGKKINQLQGRLLVAMWGELNLDAQGRWDGSIVKEAIREFYHKYVIRHDIDDVWGDKLWYEINRAGQVAKLELGLDAYSDVYDDMW